MPTGVYIRSEEYKAKLSKTMQGAGNHFYGKTHTPEARKKISDGNYSGDHSYRSLHLWVRRHKGKPTECVECHTIDGILQWANISGEYKRDLDDYQGMCNKCHMIADKLHPPIVHLRKRPRWPKKELKNAN